MRAHDFVVCKNIPSPLSYLSFSKQEMTVISDDFVIKNSVVFKSVVMYTEFLGNRGLGLNYYGTTILDWEMAQELKDKLLSTCKPSRDLKKLLNVLEQSIKEKKYVIHFGV